MSIGKSQDVVELWLGGDLLAVTEFYQITSNLWQQPSAFSLRLGHKGNVIPLWSTYVPNTPFEIRVDGKPQMRGRLDGFQIQSDANGSTINFRGRDHLKFLFDAYMKSERTFSDLTYAELVKEGLDEVLGKDKYDLEFDNEANRKIVTGNTKTVASSGSVAVAQTVEALKVGANSFEAKALPTGLAAGAASAFAAAAGSATKSKLPGVAATAFGAFVKAAGAAVGAEASDATQSATAQTGASQAQQAPRKVQGHVGGRWYDSLIKPECDRGGLFLRALATGTDDRPKFALCVPDNAQAPSYRIVRRVGQSSQVLRASWSFETTRRFSTCDVFWRKGGGTEARTGGHGHADDLEMAVLQFNQPLTVKDEKCKSIEQADFLARRKIAESRRQGWQLTYDLSGHTTLSVDGSTRLVWAYDTVVEVDDELLGLKASFYIESVTFSRGPDGTTTSLGLQRLEDVAYFTDPFDSGDA